MDVPLNILTVPREQEKCLWKKETVPYSVKWKIENSLWSSSAIFINWPMALGIRKSNSDS